MKTTSVLLAACLCFCSAWPLAARAAGTASGYFRLGDQRIEPQHAIAVEADSRTTAGATETWVYLSVSNLDAKPVAAAFDPDDGLQEQVRDTPQGSYLKLCISADGHECGIDFAHRGPVRNFSTGGYGALSLSTRTPQRIAGRLAMDADEDFFDESYRFELSFDTAITPAPGIALPEGGGEPGQAYQAYLSVLASGDFERLRALPGEDGADRFPEGDPTSAKQALKSLRDEQPVTAAISRGRLNGDEAVLWVQGTDRDDIGRIGRVRMKRAGTGWSFVEAELEAVD